MPDGDELHDIRAQLVALHERLSAIEQRLAVQLSALRVAKAIGAFDPGEAQ